MNVTIKADDENNAEKFWVEFDKKFPEIAEQARKGPVTVSVGTWHEIRQIDGFHDGPIHARSAMLEANGKTMWKGEIHSKLHFNGDFPYRDTKEQAFADAESRCTNKDHVPMACQWVGDEDYAVNTGNFYTKEEW